MKPKTPMWQIVATAWQETEALLAPHRVGVAKGSFSLDGPTNVFTMELECHQCGRTWRAYRAKRDGFLNSDYWKCPKGCNRPLRCSTSP